MHHFATHAYISLASEESTQRVFQTTTVRLGLTYPFLLRAIFSFSALHLARYQQPRAPPPQLSQGSQSPGHASDPGSPSSHEASTPGASQAADSHESSTPQPKPLSRTQTRWYKRAINDYGEALSLARSVLESIDEQNCHAALLFSSLVATIRSGIPQVSGDYGPSGVLGYVLESFSLVRGKAAIADTATAWVLKGPLKVVMADRKVNEPREIPDNILDAIESFEAMARGLQPDSMDASDVCGNGEILDPTRRAEDRRTAYLFALAGLRAYFACQPGDVAAIRITASWPARLSAPFVNDLNAYEPLALAILAYYAMMLDNQRESWFIGDTGKRLLLQISSILGPAWDRPLAPAKRQIEVEVDFWAQTTSLRAFGEAMGYGSNDGSGTFMGFVNTHGGSDSGVAVKSEQGFTPGQSQMSTPYDNASSGFDATSDDESGEPVVQDSPFGVSTMTGELPGQSRSLPMHMKHGS